MSDPTVSAMITAAGAIIGGLLGAVGAIVAARIKTSQPPNQAAQTGHRLWPGVMIGVIIGLIVGILIGTIFVFPPAHKIDVIAGRWTGTVIDDQGGTPLRIDISITSACGVNELCGTIYVPGIPCWGDLRLEQINGDIFEFLEANVTGASTCGSGGGIDILQLLPDGTMMREYTSQDRSLTSHGILKHP